MILPEGWKECQLKDFVNIKNGFAFKSQDYQEKGIPVIRISDIQNQKVLIDKAVCVPHDLNLDDFQIEKDDLLIAMSGATTGKVGVYCEDTYVLQNQRVGNIKLKDEKNGDKLFRNYLIQSLSSEILAVAYGGAQPNISAKVLGELKIHLPPLTEQKQIAQKLDKLLARVECIQTALDNAPVLLKRFRQSVLASAVSGELTKEWRERNTLKKIKIEDILESWTNIYTQNEKKYQKPKLEFNDIVRTLPDTWNETQLGYVFDIYVGSTPSRKNESYWNGNIPWVSSGEVAFTQIKDTKEKITEEGLNNTSTNIHPVGTVLLAMIGQGKTRGQPAVLDIEACHNQNTSALRINKEFTESKYLYYYLWERYEKTREVGSGNNQKALNKKIIQNLPFPLPPLKEQTEIVKKVETLFAIADKMEANITEAQKQVDRLTQSILAKAFRGELL